LTGANTMNQTSVIPVARIERTILFLRGQKVMLDSDLAGLYGVQTKALNQAVKRNIERFPADFMFQLSAEEIKTVMRSHIVTLDDGKIRNAAGSIGSLRSQTVTLKRGQHLKYRPYAFTEQGVAMLSSVLRSERAVQVNIAIMRTFVQLRQMLGTHADLARKLEALERKYDRQFRVVFDAIRELMKPVTRRQRREIGFHTSMPRSGKAANPDAKARRSPIITRQ
jgi:hypothetical protein